MTYTLAQVEASNVFLMSWFKPVLFMAVLVGWGWVVSRLDKDAAYYYLQREWLNLAQLGVGVLGFAVMLLTPWFLLGFPLGLAILGGGIVGYAAYRNQQVPEEKQWTFSLASFTQKYDDYQHSKSQRAATMALLDPKDNRIDVPTGEDPNVEAHLVFEQAMEFALQRNADRVQVAVDSTQAVMKVLIDGIAYTQPAIEPKLALHMVDYLKQAAGLDVSDRRKRQMAHFGVDASELGRHKLRLETAGSTKGVMLSMDIDHARRLRIPLKSLGLLDSQMQQLTAALDRRGGVVLVAAPPGQGTTTALYSLLEAHDPYTTSVVTMEQEIAYEAEGVNHNLMEEGLAPQLFNEKLSATLRSDPGVIMLDQLPDAETARIIAHASIDQQTRFYAPVSEADTFTALRRWLKLVADRRLAGEGLAAVVSERLVRKLCTTCRSPYTPDPAALKKLNLPADRVSQLFQASGKVMVKDKERPCPACYGIGYRGRVAVFEVMAIDNPAQAIIAEGDLDKLRSHLRKQRMLWLQEAALARVVEGVTDIGEVTRALNNQLAPSRPRTRTSKTPDADGSEKKAAKG